MKFKTDNGLLYHGDCLQIMPQLASKGVKVDCIIVDLPYGVTNCSWDRTIPLSEMWNLLYKLSQINTPMCFFGQEPFSSRLRLSNLKNFKYDWIYEKTSSTGFLNAKKQPMRCYETISVFYQKQCVYNPQMTTGHERKVSNNKNSKSEVYNKTKNAITYDSTDRYPRNTLKYSTDKQHSSLHPTQKPVGLLEYLIKTYTNEGDIVLDFTCGSGTTGIACMNTGRKYIMIEKDEYYFNVAKKRLQEHNTIETILNSM